MNNFHKSVLLQESIEFLKVSPGKKYIDATLGGGGHSAEILKRGGIVLGIDVDREAIKFVEEKFHPQVGGTNFKLRIANGNFNNIEKIAKENDFEKVTGILFDIGVSSYQFDNAERGFSFMHDAPLDMRMDKNLGVTAADLVNGLTKGELYELFTKYGEETYAFPIVRSILHAREKKPITTTHELAHIIEKSYPRKGAIHPATKVFQALRIAVNDELNSLKEALQQAIELVEKNGRIAVISFHSLEDRIVKNTFINFEEKNYGDSITKKPITPTFEEEKDNRRSRSAKLRVFEKTCE